MNSLLLISPSKGEVFKKLFLVQKPRLTFRYSSLYIADKMSLFKRDQFPITRKISPK